MKMGANQSLISTNGHFPRFVRFQDVPEEIRLKIWLYTIQPRVVDLVVSRHRRGWTLKSTSPPPAALSICHESRSAVYPYYSALDFKTSNITDPEDDMKDPIDIAPYILFNFALDIVSFPYLPQTQKDMPASAHDLCLKIEFARELGPGFRRVLNLRERMLRWPDYVFDGAEAVSTWIHGKVRVRGNWSRVRHLRIDARDFMNSGTIYGFAYSVVEMSARIERKDFALVTVDVVLASRPGGKQMRVFRLARRLTYINDEERAIGDVLSKDGAVIFADWLRDKQCSCSFFEVVDPDTINAELIKQIGEFSRQKLGQTDNNDFRPRMHHDLDIFWGTGKGFGQGQMMPVQGLCLPWYGRDLDKSKVKMPRVDESYLRGSDIKNRLQTINRNNWNIPITNLREMEEYYGPDWPR